MKMFCIYVGIDFDKQSNRYSTVKYVNTSTGMTRFRHEFFIIDNWEKTEAIMYKLIKYADEYKDFESWCKP